MDIQKLNEEIRLFSSETHGSTDYDKEENFVIGDSPSEFAPMRYLQKKFPEFKEINDILKLGYVFDSLDLSNNEWTHFSSKTGLAGDLIFSITIILHRPNLHTPFCTRQPLW